MAKSNGVPNRANELIQHVFLSASLLRDGRRRLTGPNLSPLMQQGCADRILRGEKPPDLPVRATTPHDQPKTGRDLNLTVLPRCLARPMSISLPRRMRLFMALFRSGPIRRVSPLLGKGRKSTDASADFRNDPNRTSAFPANLASFPKTCLRRYDAMFQGLRRA